MSFEEEFRRRQLLNKKNGKAVDAISASSIELEEEERERVEGILNRLKQLNPISMKEYEEILPILRKAAYKADEKTWSDWRGEIEMFQDPDMATRILMDLEAYLSKKAA